MQPTEQQDPRRKYPRVELPNGISVGWRGGGKQGTSKINSVSLGGIFIVTPDPPDNGSVLALIFDVPAGEVRARALVKRAVPGQGMGVQFVNMGYEDRARLFKLLSDLFEERVKRIVE
ncbi:MAG: PilZ domain-containing protein [Terriglobales bacterium]